MRLGHAKPLTWGSQLLLWRKVWASQSFLPDTIMAFRMDYAQHRNDVLFNQEDDSIGEAVGKHPPHGVSAMSNGINERIQCQQCHGLADFMDELSAESWLAFLVPKCGCFNVGLDLGRTRSW